MVSDDQKESKVPHIDVLLRRNAEFAAAGRHQGVPLMPRQRTFVITCLDPRVEPAGFLGLEPGDAMVIRNAGGRVTPEVLLDLAFITALAERQVPAGPLFEIAVVHHTRCGSAALADAGFRRGFATRTGVTEQILAGQAVTDPDRSVREDVEQIRACPWLSDRLTVSGHVYDLDTGRARTLVAATPVLDPSPVGDLEPAAPEEQVGA